jgi:uncharacterized membrane protein
VNTRIHHYWDKVVSSYWFVPALMLGGAAALAFGALYLDSVVLVAGQPSEWLYAGGPEGAQTLLSTVAGSVVTVAGVVFSITVAALTQASGQFGPRLLRNFMRDTGNQLVLGTFVATFLYCVLVLRAVPEGQAVPHLSVTLAVVISNASLGVFVYFIHHVSTSMQAPNVVARAATELREVLGRRAADRAPVDRWLVADPAATRGPGGTVCARESGYLQALDEAALLTLARKKNLWIELLRQPGDFVSEGQPVARIWPEAALDRSLARALRRSLLVGRQRTTEQDIAHGLGQVVEVGVRALSPGINDPFTAMTCIDWLADAVRRLAPGRPCAPWRQDEAGVPRLRAPEPDFSELIRAAFDPLRAYGRSSASVTLHLVDTLAALAPELHSEGQRAALLRQVRLVAQDGTAPVSLAAREEVTVHCQRAVHALGGALTPHPADVEEPEGATGPARVGLASEPVQPV